MDIRQVTDTFAVSPQISVEDVESLAEAGFKTIICNRPDNEEIGQTAFGAVEAKAEQFGLTFFHIPIAAGMFGPHHIAQMEEALGAQEGKVLAYCRSGTRSIMLWAFQEVAHRPRDEVLSDAQAAGYDLSQQI